MATAAVIKQEDFSGVLKLDVFPDAIMTPA